MNQWSGPSLIVFVLLMNFACIDWVMSLNPEWYSSMLVVEFVTEQAVVTMAWCILSLRFLSDFEPVRGILTVKIVHDLGNLLLGFTCFWTYVTFMEYIIIWTGNLPHEVGWFSDRSSAGWKFFAVFLVFVHFVIPLFCLIMTSISKNLVRLARVAALMILAHFAQVVWWIEPAFGKPFHIAWTSIVLIVALGAIWLAEYARNLAAALLWYLANFEQNKRECRCETSRIHSRFGFALSARGSRSSYSQCRESGRAFGRHSGGDHTSSWRCSFSSWKKPIPHAPAKPHRWSWNPNFLPLPAFADQPVARSPGRESSRRLAP